VFPTYAFALWGGSASEFRSANKCSTPRTRGQHGQQRDNESETHLYQAFFLVSLRGKRKDLVLDRENDAGEWLSPTFNLCRTLLCPVRYFASSWGASVGPCTTSGVMTKMRESFNHRLSIVAVCVTKNIKFATTSHYQAGIQCSLKN
jgi:hypothetical protein